MKRTGRTILFFLIFWFTFVNVAYSTTEECTRNFQAYPQSPVIVRVGSRHTVSCQARSTIFFDWYKGSTALSGSALGNNNLEITDPPDNDLIFRNFQPDDAGIYSCRVTNQNNVEEGCFFEVLVPESPSVSLANSTYMVSVGEPRLVISPVINLGRPQGTIKWFHEGVLLQSSSHIGIDNSTGILTFMDIQPFHRGQYTIQVKNEHSNSSASFSLKVLFLVQPTVEVQGNNLVCTVMGYWNEQPMFSWDPPPGLAVDGAPLPPINSTTLQDRQTAMSVTCVAYVCTVSIAGSEGRSDPVTRCGSLMIVPVGNTGVMITWNQIDGTSSYHIRYGLMGQSPEERLVSQPVSGTEQSLTITGLMADRMYQFELGRVSDRSAPAYSTPSSITLGRCTATTPTMAVMNVRAGLDSEGSRKTVKLTWDAATETSVTGYRVSVTTTPPQSVIVTGTSFTLDPDYCNGTYQYTVEAVNECNLGSAPKTVSFTCATLVQFSVVSTSDQTFTFKIDANSSLIKMPLSIMVSNILPQPNDVIITTHTYDVLTFRSELCVKNLQSNTYYNICLCVNSEAPGIGKQNICIQHNTNDAKPESTTSCLDPTQTSTSMIENSASSSGGFPDWAIAVIVVGCLAVIALGFCCVGVYYACSSNKSKEYIYGSTPSLQASSVNMPPHSIHSAHRATSPPRSCLSYHHSNGHSTNWSEHRDTLRQMETDKGTHV